MLNVDYFNVNKSGWVLMLGLIVYAVFVFIGLAVSATLLSYSIVRVIKTREQRLEQDSGLKEFAPGTVGRIAS